MSELLNNAVVSIQLGLEDFASKDERRTISAARNLYSGVLLLCKEVLRQLSPPDSNDLLIRTKKKAVKGLDGFVRLVGDGKKTVNRLEIEETFKQLQLSVDLSKLKRLADIRNDIEHMHSNAGPALVQEAIADSMPLIRALVVNELGEEPSALLGAAAWDALLNEARVFNEEKEACLVSFGEIDWESVALEKAFNRFECPNCSSTLLRNDNDSAKILSDLVLICSKCGQDVDHEIVVENAIKESLAGEAYSAAKDGDVSPLEVCPECFRETFIVSENGCVLCGFSLKGERCAVCSAALTVEDYMYNSSGLCSYHQYVLEKDD
jgi:DNA-directed RNA polymerase subunit M/transcription elongation factor TFIIS